MTRELNKSHKVISKKVLSFDSLLRKHFLHFVLIVRLLLPNEL